MSSKKHVTPIKKRIHTQSEDNIKVSERLSSVFKRPRLNTIQNSEDLINEKLSLTRSATKAIISPIKYCIFIFTKMRPNWLFPVRAGQYIVLGKISIKEDGDQHGLCSLAVLSEYS